MKAIIVEKGITYHLAEDGMYYPDLKLPQEETPHFTKYGCLRKAYLKNSSLLCTQNC
ncbi:MAG: TnpV protein [Eubacteriales bacterium]|nr:TnpV protein [Eubacteriales bacterium]